MFVKHTFIMQREGADKKKITPPPPPLGTDTLNKSKGGESLSHSEPRLGSAGGSCSGHRAVGLGVSASMG